MSGGRFDYKQYCIGDIADSIVAEIARAKRPLPPPTIRKSVMCKVRTGEKSFSLMDVFGIASIVLMKQRSISGTMEELKSSPSVHYLTENEN